MPISIQAPEGLIRPEAEAKLFKKVMDSFMRINGAEGNPFFGPNLIGDFVAVSPTRMYAGGILDNYVAVGLKVPTIALVTDDLRQAFITEVTDAVDEAVEGKLARNRIFVNLVYGAGMWGIGGKLYTDESLGAAIMAAQG